MEEKYFDKVKVSFTLSESVMNQFRDACSKLGVKMSPRVELLLQKDTKVLDRLAQEMEEVENEK